jgi:ABC-2 type transport system permease protein
MSFLTWPMFFFSGAPFDLKTSASYIRAASVLNPVTYAVDLMRIILLGQGDFPVWADLAAIAFFCVVATAIGVWAFGTLQQEK